MDLGSSLGDRWVDVLDEDHQAPYFSDATSSPASMSSSSTSHASRGMRNAPGAARQGRDRMQAGAGASRQADLLSWAVYSSDLLRNERLLWQERAILVNTAQLGVLALTSLRILFLPQHTGPGGAVELGASLDFGSPFFTTVERVTKTCATLPKPCLVALEADPSAQRLHWTRHIHVTTKDGRLLAYAVDSNVPSSRNSHSPLHHPHHPHQPQHQQQNQHYQQQHLHSHPQGHASSQAHFQHLYSPHPGALAPLAHPLVHPAPALPQHHQGCPSVAEAILRLLPKSAADLAAFQTGCTLAARLAGVGGARERACPAGGPGGDAAGGVPEPPRLAEGGGDWGGDWDRGGGAHAEPPRGPRTDARGGGALGMGPRGNAGVVAEYERVLGLLPRGMRRRWRVSAANVGYHLCLSYPHHLVLPADLRDEEAFQAATFRARGRIPAFCWQHPGTGAVLSRSSQPLVGIMMNNRCEADEKLVALLNGSAALPGEALGNGAASVGGAPGLLPGSPDQQERQKAYGPLTGGSSSPRMQSRSGAGSREATSSPRTSAHSPGAGGGYAADGHATGGAAAAAAGGSGSGACSGSGSAAGGGPGGALPVRRMVIADARPRKNALANGAMGGGSEPPASYKATEVVYLGIENIHVVRDSLQRLREFLDTHGGATSDGAVSLLRSGGTAWAGGSVSSSAQVAQALTDTGWLHNVHTLLAGAAYVATLIAVDGTSVLVHCSDGWDRTPSLVTLALLMLDPFYRTFQGFQALVETHWAAFGHQFAERLGVPGEPPRAPVGCCAAAATTGPSPSPPALGRRRVSVPSTAHLGHTGGSTDHPRASAAAPNARHTHTPPTHAGYSQGGAAGAGHSPSSPPPPVPPASASLHGSAFFRSSPALPVSSASFHGGAAGGTGGAGVVAPRTSATASSHVARAPTAGVATATAADGGGAMGVATAAAAASLAGVPALSAFADSTLAAVATPSAPLPQPNQAPVFLQWIDCVAQLLRLYPQHFEFSTGFVVDFLDATLSCRFTNFLGNSERDRQLMRERLCACRREAPAGPGYTQGTGEGPLGSPAWEPQGPSTTAPGATDSGCIWAYLRRKRGPCPWRASSRGVGLHRQGGPGHASGAPPSPEEEGGVESPDSLREGLGSHGEEGSYSHEHWNPLYCGPPHLSPGRAAPGAPEDGIGSGRESVLLQLLPPAAPLSPVLIPELHFRWTHSAPACASLGPGAGVPRGFQGPTSAHSGGFASTLTAVARLELRRHPVLAELRWLHRELAASRQREAAAHQSREDAEAEVSAMRAQLAAQEDRLGRTELRLAEEEGAHMAARQEAEASRGALECLTKAIAAVGCECAVRLHVAHPALGVGPKASMGRAEGVLRASVSGSSWARGSACNGGLLLPGEGCKMGLPGDMRGDESFGPPLGSLVASSPAALPSLLHPSASAPCLPASSDPADVGPSTSVGHQQRGGGTARCSPACECQGKAAGCGREAGGCEHGWGAAGGGEEKPKGGAGLGTKSEFQVSLEVPQGAPLCLPSLLCQCPSVHHHACRVAVQVGAHGGAAPHNRSAGAGRGVHQHHCQSILTGLQADFEALRCTPIVEYFGASAERSERSHRREGTASAI